MIKIPSIHYLVQAAGKSLARFPLSIIAASIAAGLGIYLNEDHDNLPNIFPFINIMLCALLGIALFFCLDVFTSGKGYSKRTGLLADLLGLVILTLLYFTLPDIDSTQNTSLPYIRYTLYAIIVHLLVAFVPFLNKGQLNGFWQYNRILFVRFLTSMLYSGFLYAGLALALGSLHFLFDIDLHNELFLDLFILIGYFFNTWFFVSGIPEKFEPLDEIQEYPKGIKIFSQYVLLTLLILYLLILYIYMSKIVLFWNWPKGLVSYLVACVAVLGILTLLLIYPYGTLPGNTWIRKFSRAYYFILFPLVILLFIAIGMRLDDYGITINRYIILTLGVWLTIVCIYFSAGKNNIKFVPVSLVIILSLVSFGYWGMFSVSERSQVNRLKIILESGKILKDGKIQQEVQWRKDSLPELYALNKNDTNEGVLNDSLHNEVKSILDYLDNHHGFASLRDWYDQDLDSIVRANNIVHNKWSRMNEAEAYMKSMGLLYDYRDEAERNTYFSYGTESENKTVTDIRNYDYLVGFQFYGSTSEKSGDYSFHLKEEGYKIRYPKSPQDKFYLISDRDTISYAMDKLIQHLQKQYGHQPVIPEADMILMGHNENMNTKIELDNIYFHEENNTLRITSITGNIFIKLNHQD